MPSTKFALLNFVALTALISTVAAPAAHATKPHSGYKPVAKHASPIPGAGAVKATPEPAEDLAREQADTEEESHAQAKPKEKASAQEEGGTDVEAAYAAAVEKASALRTMAQNQSLEHYDLARYYWSRWNLKMAELEYQSAIMYFPELKVAHRDYCILSMFTAHPSRSLAELMMVVGLGEPIPFTDDEKATFKKHAAKLHNQQGIAYGRKNRWDRAISEFRWALTYSPDNAAIERSLAFSYAKKGDFEMAERSYMRSFSEDPADGYSHADFAFLLADNGGGDKALKQLSEAVKLEPKDPALHVDMGWMAESKGDLATAQNEFQQAVKLSPKHAGLWAHLGKVLEREGKAKDATNAYSEALALDPGQDEAKQRLDNLKNQKSETPSTPTSAENSRKES